LWHFVRFLKLLKLHRRLPNENKDDRKEDMSETNTQECKVPEKTGIEERVAWLEQVTRRQDRVIEMLLKHQHGVRGEPVLSMYEIERF
jgi:hypothetical protein